MVLMTRVLAAWMYGLWTGLLMSSEVGMNLFQDRLGLHPVFSLPPGWRPPSRGARTYIVLLLLILIQPQLL